METRVDIREMQRADLPQVAEVLGRAYATNPFFLAVYRDKLMIARQLSIRFEAKFKYGPGECFVSELDGQIVGGMRIIKSPDCKRMSLKARLSILRVAGGLGPLMREMKIIGVWKKHHPNQPHWHLGAIGVTPEIQRKGIGSHLIKFYCDLIDRDGIEAYHETDRPENVPFYERFGFKVAGEEIVIGVKSWYMLRPAKLDK
ncbi:MAG: GNAT family N-acetyltransferase [Promethearchaeota archaeon]